MTPFKALLAIFLLCSALPACAPRIAPPPPVTPASPVPDTASPVPSETSTPTLLPTQSPLPTATATPTLLPTGTPSPTPVPTYVFLRGEVNVEHASCRYGPGAPYLYKYGLVGGSNLEIIGRNDPGTWIEIRAIGGNNPCWVKASLLNVRGDVMGVAPIAPDDVGLPQSPYYGPPTGISATRSGNEITVSWDTFVLRPGDDSEQFPYLVEAWVCVGGQIVFTPLGTYETSIKITDEPGCSSPSHGRVYAVEKHGYTRWVVIPWSPAP